MCSAPQGSSNAEELETHNNNNNRNNMLFCAVERHLCALIWFPEWNWCATTTATRILVDECDANDDNNEKWIDDESASTEKL